MVNSDVDMHCYFCCSKRLKLSLSQRTIQFLSNKYRFVYCQECFGFSLYPNLSESQLLSMYSADYVDQDQEDQTPSDESSSTRFTDLKKHLERFGESHGKAFLDYGCGAYPPTFQFAKENGYIPFGMELSADVREMAKFNTGVKLFSKEEIQNGNQLFDVIFLGDVIEHLVDPVSELKFLQTKLTSGGVLLAQGPVQGAKTLTHLSVRLFVWIFRRKVSIYPPYHVSLASSLSMRRLLELSNFQLTYLQIFEVAWPAPSFSELKEDFCVRSLMLFLTKQIDTLLARVIMNYGTRYFLAASPNTLK